MPMHACPKPCHDAYVEVRRQLRAVILFIYFFLSSTYLHGFQGLNSRLPDLLPFLSVMVVPSCLNLPSLSPEGTEARQHCPSARHRSHQGDSDIRVWILGEFSRLFQHRWEKAWCLYNESVNILWHDKTFIMMWKVGWIVGLGRALLLWPAISCTSLPGFCLSRPPCH